MILTVMRIAWLNLRRDRVAQAMTFVLPIAFFSIFALVFGNPGGGGARPVRVAVVDQDASPASRAFVEALAKESALRLVTTARPRQAAQGKGVLPLDRTRAEALVKDGDVPLALVLPAGFGAALGSFEAPAQAELLADPSDPIAAPLVEGLIQKTAVSAEPQALARGGLAMFEKHAGALTPQQRAVMDQWLSAQSAGEAAADAGPAGSLVATKTVAVVGGGGPDPSLIAFYAAGMASAASAFGIVLATACRSRAQLLVLAALFLAAARRLARRWETQ